MPYPCDPCDCPEAYYRDEESFRKAVIVLLSQATGPLEGCDPGVCPEMWYRDEESWRKAVIIQLCALAAIVGG